MTASARVVERRVYYAGDYIFRQGEQGEVAFVVESGEVEIVRRGDDGSDIRLGTIAKGGIFGEMALIDDQPRMASAKALQQSVIMIVPRSTFQQKLNKADPFLRRLLGIFVRNIRSMAADR